MMRMSRDAAKRKKAGQTTTTSQTAEALPPKFTTAGDVGLQQPSTSRRDHCPVDKDELGRSTWKLLHTMAAYYPDTPSSDEKSAMKTTIESLSKVYPF